jgi:hypothetical protein
MIPQEVRRKRDELAAAACKVRWCDDYYLDAENMPGAGPGQHLNRFEWFVVGTTVGGNAVVVGKDDPGVYFADHTWYDDLSIDYQDFRQGGEWVSAEFNEANVRRSLFPLAASVEEFVTNAAEIDVLLDRID